MAASLTITFDEKRHQQMLQQKQNVRTHKRTASGHSVNTTNNSPNSGSTSTPRTIFFGTLGPFPLPEEQAAPAKKQKIASQCVTAVTPKAIPAKPQPANSQVRPKTWSPGPSPKQRRSRASAKPAYLAPLKENRFFPLSYMKEEKPISDLTPRSIQHHPACSYRPKIKSYITKPPQAPAKACNPAVRP